MVRGEPDIGVWLSDGIGHAIDIRATNPLVFYQGWLPLATHSNDYGRIFPAGMAESREVHRQGAREEPEKWRARFFRSVLVPEGAQSLM